MEGQGSVTLVGAGPGDAGLLTVSGRQAVENAEVVLYDRLAGDEVLALIPGSALRVDVGKSSGAHPVPQDEINRILVEHASRGKRVVRLKGGDPYLFGRGAEEAEELAKAGINFSVIPGITAALAVPAAAGIPVTHRDFSSSVHIHTGHHMTGERAINYKAAAQIGGTHVFMMGVSALPGICAGLIGAGMPCSTPAALIQNGTRPNQRKLISDLETLPTLAREQGFEPPCVLVVGDVCGLSDTLDWRSQAPLFGKRVLVTRPVTAPGTLTERLRGMGCSVHEHPCIELTAREQPPDFVDSLSEYGWIIFTSAYGAKLFFELLHEHGKDARFLSKVKLAAVGSGTAECLKGYGVRADLVPEIYDTIHLGKALIEASKPGERMLLFRSASGSKELTRRLSQAGILFDDVAAYDQRSAGSMSRELRDELLGGGIDLVAFTSASTVEGFSRAAGEIDLTKVKCVCIGEATANAARALGMSVSVSERATVDSLAETVRTLLHKSIPQP